MKRLLIYLGLLATLLAMPYHAKADNEENHDYYWVSPQITNNQKLPYFKLTALRNRSGSFGDGKISDKYFTFTIKNDDLRRYDGTAINDGEKIEWYIARDDDEVWFRPSTDDSTPTESNTSLNIGNSEGYDGNIGYRNFNNCKVYDANNTHKFAFNKGANSTNTSDTDYKNTVKSYTFILNSSKSNDITQGNVYFNYAHNSSPVTTGDCYLLGNFKSATETEYVCNPGDPVYVDENNNPYGPRKMTQYWYVGSTKYETLQNPCDSIVYEIKVNKPTNGWGNLYLDINPGDNTSWNRVYRPLISLGNTLDGRALIGGLTTAGAGMSNNEGDQSLNPETSNDYTSYTFRFNATTYTYQLEFHTSLYLVGPGVSATQGSGSWDISKPSTFDPRIRLTATQEKDHYRNRVYFTQGQPFRFIKNIDESATPNYKYTWYENNNKPKWKTANNEEDYYPGSETQFLNYIQYESDGLESSTEPKDATTNSMTFDLPTGWYYVNFYPNAGTPYYTIEHSMELRDFNEVYYRSAAVPAGEQRIVNGCNDYNFLRVWSDHIAWNKPDNIDVFVVSAFGHNAETHETTATLKKLDVNYIPAKTGVILGCKLSKDNLTSGLVYDNAATLAYKNGEDVNYYNTLTAELTPYSAPSTISPEESKLIPLYSETSLQRFSDETGIGTGDGYANYLFGFYRCKKYQKNYSGNDNDFQMGFWLTTGIGKTYANSAFLHLTKAQAEDLGVGTAYNTSAPAASAPAFMLLFDESDDNVITGISDITTAKGNSVASQGWYTLQGVRTPKPTQRGIYIYNGKKVIVND